MKARSRLLAIFLVAIAMLLFVWAFVPKPIRVETGRVARGTLQVSVDEEAETRVHDRFEIATPVAGRLRRIELHASDPVTAGQPLAQIEPLPLDPQQRDELLARLESARASQREAEALVERMRAEYEQAERNFVRASKLSTDGVISREQLELAETAEANANKTLDAATFKARAAEYEVRAAQAALIALATERGGKPAIVTLRSPINGQVLRMLQQSERVLTAGTPVLQVGHPSELEIVSDVLSTEAVKVRPGNPVLIENWGGEGVVHAQVRTVESSGFMKISALGVEEQRVNIVMDFIDPPGRLGDGYRMDIRIIVWEGNHILTVPASALFRRGQSWNAFIIENGRARSLAVEIGHRNPLQVEVLKGLQEGGQVILHPGNQITDGARVRN